MRPVGAAAVLGVVLVGCGVQPTGVIDAGEPASGLTRGMRLYYASADGLRAVPLIDKEVDDLAGVLKLLAQEPPEGLISLVQLDGYSATGSGSRVTVHIDGPYGGSGRDQGTGQVVCTLARAQSVLDPKVGADDVEVTLRPSEGAVLGPYRCADFLNR
ncbi:GerMN domain-containing protein [Streptomyces sp. NPDC001732]